MATNIKQTGTLNYKRVATYFKKAGTTHISRFGDEFILSNSFHMVKVLKHPELSHFLSFDPAWERATLENGEFQEYGQNALAMWQLLEGKRMKHLTITTHLHEVPDGKPGKSGTFYRHLLFDGNEDAIFVSKVICDMLSPDLDELKEFTFESEGFFRPIRVTGRDGIIAYLMPAQKAR